MLKDKFKYHRKINVKPKKKSCGSCQNFIKFTNTRLRGLCDLFDWKISPDSPYGHTCTAWKGIPYKREKHDNL